MPARILALLFLLSVLGCDEELPPRDDPTQVFASRLSAWYPLSVSDTNVTLRITSVNRYDEVLDGPARFFGTFTVTWLRDRSYTRTFSLTAANIVYVPFYSSQTGIVRIPPGDSIAFVAKFDLIDDQGRDLRRAFQYYLDPTCSARRIAARETFLLEGSLRVYDRTGVSYPQQILFDLCHVTAWIGPNVCPPITSSTGCQ